MQTRIKAKRAQTSAITLLSTVTVNYYLMVC